MGGGVQENVSSISVKENKGGGEDCYSHALAWLLILMPLCVKKGLINIYTLLHIKEIKQQRPTI